MTNDELLIVLIDFFHNEFMINPDAIAEWYEERYLNRYGNIDTFVTEMQKRI